jgi:hypothetical protein
MSLSLCLRPGATDPNRRAFEHTAEEPAESAARFTALKLSGACYKGMSRYRLDDLIESAMDPRTENVALTLLAASCLAGIVVIWRR